MVDLGGQLGDGGVGVQGAQVQAYAEGLVDADQQLGGLQGVAADEEEVVVGAEAVGVLAQDGVPQLGEGLLGGGGGAGLGGGGGGRGVGWPRGVGGGAARGRWAAGSRWGGSRSASQACSCWLDGGAWG